MNTAAADQLVTERLILRRLVHTDLDAFFEIHGDPRTNQFNPAGPMQSREGAEERLSAWCEHWHTHRFGYWAVATRHEPGHVLGFGGIMRRQIGGRSRLNLYFRLRPEAWGHGYASELAAAALRLAFDGLAEDSVVATVRPANEPSIRALMRAGLTLCGKLDDANGGADSLVYEITVGKYHNRVR